MHEELFARTFFDFLLLISISMLFVLKIIEIEFSFFHIPASKSLFKVRMNMSMQCSNLFVITLNMSAMKTF